ncbi:hypothetical protein MPTK1_8g03200 [Marchantia polymorpha subsp. ruderalis]|nr:hypothetical protein Mp_8g03200 [Marchantia polymorpha subsp. ruderalis]
MRKTFALVQIILAAALIGSLAYQGWVTKGSRIRIENKFKSNEQVTFSCPPGELYLINVTRGSVYHLQIPKQTQNLWCLFARKLDVNYWDCKGVIELQLTCRTGPVDCESHRAIDSLAFNEFGVFVNNKLHSKWKPRYKHGSVARLE